MSTPNDIQDLAASKLQGHVTELYENQDAYHRVLCGAAATDKRVLDAWAMESLQDGDVISAAIYQAARDLLP